MVANIPDDFCVNNCLEVPQQSCHLKRHEILSQVCVPRLAKAGHVWGHLPGHFVRKWGTSEPVLPPHELWRSTSAPAMCPSKCPPKCPPQRIDRTQVCLFRGTSQLYSFYLIYYGELNRRGVLYIGGE